MPKLTGYELCISKEGFVRGSVQYLELGIYAMKVVLRGPNSLPESYYALLRLH